METITSQRFFDILTDPKVKQQCGSAGLGLNGPDHVGLYATYDIVSRGPDGNVCRLGNGEFYQVCDLPRK